MSRLSPNGFLEAAGRRLEYRWIEPDAAGFPALVLLHEGLGCVAMWKDFPERLAARTGCGVFAYSRAGYGGSDAVPVPRPLHYMHDEGSTVLPAVLEAAGLDDVVLLGHSDGASISIIYAGGAKDGRARGLILLAPHVFNEQLSVDSICAARTAFENTGLRARLARYHGDNVDCAFWGWNRVWLDPGFRHWNIEEHLPHIRVPVLVIQGESDEYGTLAQVEAIRRRVPAPVEVRLLPDCRHSPHRDRAEETLDAVTRFVAALERAAVGREAQCPTAYTRRA